MQSEIISQEKPPTSTLSGTTKRSHNKKSNTSDHSVENSNHNNFDETSNDGLGAPFSPAISVQSKESKSSTASRKRKKDASSASSSVKIKKVGAKKEKKEKEKEKEKETEPIRNPNKTYLNVRGYNFFIPDKPIDEIEQFEPETEDVTFQGLTLKITKYEKEKVRAGITTEEEKEEEEEDEEEEEKSDQHTSPELQTLPSCDSNKTSTN